jgi:hypothetical protein
VEGGGAGQTLRGGEETASASCCGRSNEDVLQKCPALGTLNSRGCIAQLLFLFPLSLLGRWMGNGNSVQVNTLTFVVRVAAAVRS